MPYVDEQLAERLRARRRRISARSTNVAGQPEVRSVDEAVRGRAAAFTLSTDVSVTTTLASTREITCSANRRATVAGVDDERALQRLEADAANVKEIAAGGEPADRERSASNR